MRFFLISFGCYVGRFLLSLRYSVKVKSTFEIKSKRRGILFLPNHPARIDPVILTLLLWPRFKVHPLVIEYVSRSFPRIMKIIGAIAIPNFETSVNDLKLDTADKVMRQVVAGLKRKENYILYPAGKLKHSGQEVLGGASAVHSILRQVPDVNVFLVRIVGLWGSSFSRAISGKAPEFKKNLFSKLTYLLSNLIFFTPRRKVEIEIIPAPEDFPQRAPRLELNKYLEAWYNRYPYQGKIVASEPLTLVSYSLWKEEIPKVYLKKEERKRVIGRKFSKAVEKKVYSEIARLRPEIMVERQMNLATDLGLDSLEMAELVSFLSIHFDIGEVHPSDIQTIEDVLELAEGYRKIPREVEKIKFRWKKEKERKEPFFSEGITIQEVFLKSCQRMGGKQCCADDLLGPLSYNKMKVAVIAISRRLKKLPTNKIAVLLPSSCSSYLLILAILLAKKVPVMLNWTLGPRYLNYMLQLSDAKYVISSWNFLEQLINVRLGKVKEHLYFLEDIKRDITWRDKISSFLISKKDAMSILRKLKLHQVKEEDTCVILFTSGTEASPKGVPLSHKNIIANQRAAFESIQINAEDTLYGILPPFHSFGFSVAGLFAILAGVKIAYFPDPTDSYGLAHGIKRWKATLLCSAPSFLKGLLQVAKESEIRSLRLIVTGAEKASEELFRKVGRINKTLLEGYGITECAPVLTLTREGEKRKGVGKPLPGVEFCTIHPETKELLLEGEEGELCVRGPNVFSGYLGKRTSPFVTIKGKKWYATGDIGYLDESGNVILSGRLKRFIKIGGEMVSLKAIEDVLMKNIKQEDGPNIALCTQVEEEKPRLILFASIPLEKSAVNSILLKEGFSRLVKIDEIKEVDYIPLTGIGKIDYRFLLGEL